MCNNNILHNIMQNINELKEKVTNYERLEQLSALAYMV